MMSGSKDKEFSGPRLFFILILSGMLMLTACVKKGDEFYAVERYEAAADLYVQAAEQGDVAKMMKLAEMYATGKIDYHRDYKQAVYWYTKAAGQGVVAAMFELGFIYEYGQGDVVQNYSQAQHWYTQAATRDHAYAQYRMAHVQAEQVADDNSDAAIEAFQSFLKAEDLARSCGDLAQCRIVSNDSFNYRWLLERNLSVQQKQQARDNYQHSATIQ